jgi:hypothetical protein
MENTTQTLTFMGKELGDYYAPISDVIYNCEAFVETKSTSWFGHFMTCVLSNDLFGAMAFADLRSRNNLPLIVEFLENEGDIVRRTFSDLR